MSEPAAARPAVAVLGAGSIGVAFAIRFASAGFEVRLYDVAEAALERAAAELDERLAMLAEAGLLDGEPADVRHLMTYTTDMATAAGGVALVQECAPERVELKRDLFAAVAAVAPEAVLASSSSAITAGLIAEIGDEIADDIADDIAGRLLVAHPANPPYLLPVIELVPSARTADQVLARARRLYTDAGMKPVVVHHEPEGFIFNRLQGAVLREAYCLVRDGVASVDDIDEVMRSGLGRRWSVIGPFETVDLNTRGGLASHAEKMGPAYARMGAERGQDDPWTPDLVATAVAQRRDLVPLEEWEDRVEWRDRQLIRLTPLWEQIAAEQG